MQADPSWRVKGVGQGRIEMAGSGTKRGGLREKKG